MRHATIVMAGLVLAMAGMGCSSDKVEAPSTQNFARAWHLTRCEYVNEANASEKIDLVTNGWVVNLYINDNGMFLFSATPPGGSEQTIDGAWSASGSIVTLTPTGASFSWQFTAQVTETSMTLSGAHAEYDFKDDGTPEAAIWNMAGHP